MPLVELVYLEYGMLNLTPGRWTHFNIKLDFSHLNVVYVTVLSGNLNDANRHQ